MKILLTAFDAFGGETVNPALEAVNRVSAPEGVELVKMTLPTVFNRCLRLVSVAIERERPDAVVSVGLSGAAAAVTPERIAVNLMDCTKADNEGQTFEDEPIVDGADNALFSTLPVKKMAEAIREAGVPSQLSNSAGTFVCNQLMYGELLLCARRYPHTQAGFIHVPFLPEQAEGRPQRHSLPLDSIVTGLEAALRAIAEQK